MVTSKKSASTSKKKVVIVPPKKKTLAVVDNAASKNKTSKNTIGQLKSKPIPIKPTSTAPTKSTSKAPTKSTSTTSKSTAVPRYPLYHTLTVDTSKFSKSLTQADFNKLISTINKFDETRMIAVLMLIFEHRRLKDDEKAPIKDEDTKFTLPPGVTQSSNGVNIDPRKLDLDLQHVLLKFVSIN